MASPNTFRYVEGPYLDAQTFVFQVQRPYEFCFHSYRSTDLSEDDFHLQDTTMFILPQGHVGIFEIQATVDGRFRFHASSQPSRLIQREPKIAKNAVAAANRAASCVLMTCQNPINNDCPPNHLPHCVDGAVVCRERGTADEGC